LLQFSVDKSSLDQAWTRKSLSSTNPNDVNPSCDTSKFQDSDVPKLQSLKQSELKSGKMSEKLFKEKIKIEVDAKADDGEVSNQVVKNGFPTLRQNGQSQNGLPNSFHHDCQGMQLEDALPFTLLQSDGMPKNDQELHSTVSEVIDRVNSQEMKSNTEL